jgi:Domain of unknown function (DUF427)
LHAPKTPITLNPNAVSDFGRIGLTISQDLKDIQQQHLDRGQQVTLCEWKGQANYFDVIAGNRRAENAAWT